MHIAIIVPAFNVAEFLADAVRSVLRQTHRDWSMIIVDDGSTDATAAVAAHFQDKRIELIRQCNAGVSAARNAGVSAAGVGDVTPDAFLFLDADDWLAPDAIWRMAKALDDWPRAAAAVGRFVRVGVDVAAHVGPRPQQGDLLERLLIRNLFANGGHLLIRREAIEAAGHFRTDLSYGEDWEYWTRLALVGEFVAVRSAAPLLFVRERLGGAYLSRATNPDVHRPAMAAIYCNPCLAERLGATRLASLARRSEAEMAWTVGREHLRHGCRHDGLRWLVRSLRGAPTVKRLALLGLAWLEVGPFRPYPSV